MSDPTLTARVMEDQLRRRLGRVDELTADRNLDAALAELGAIERAFGPTTDVVLRRALLRLEQGRIPDIAELSAGFGRLQEGELLLRETVARLQAASGARREGLEQVRAAIETELARAASGVPRARPWPDGNGRVGLRFSFLDSRRPAADLGDVLAGLRRGARLYVEQSPRFADLDWSQPFDRILLQAVEARVGRLEAVPIGDAREFRPSVIYGTHADQAYQHVDIIPIPRVPSSALRCAEEDPSCDEPAQPDVIYVLRAA